MSVSPTIVTQYYNAIFRELPSAAQLASYGQMVNEAALLNSMLSTAEVGVDPIIRLYQSAFNRLPDAAGMTYWVTQYTSGSMTINQIANSFVVQPEFVDDYGGLDNSQFVGALYNNVLQRTGDAAGLAYWIEQLDTGVLTRAQVLYNFALSPEFTDRVAANVDQFLTNIALTPLASQGDASLYSGSLFDVIAEPQYLTVNTDTIIGGEASDIVYGTDTTLTVFDSIEGGGGTDTLSLTFANDVDAVPGGVVVDSVEVVTVRAAGDVVMDMSSWTGVNTVTVLGVGAGNDVEITSAASQSVTVTANGGISITDDTAASIVATTGGVSGDNADVTAELATTVSLTNVNGGTSTLTTPELETLTLARVATTADTRILIEDLTSTTLTINAGTGPINFTTGQNDVTVVDNDGAVDTINLNVTDDVFVNLDFYASATAGATTLNIDGAGLLALNDNDGTGDNGLDAVTAINISGDVTLWSGSTPSLVDLNADAFDSTGMAALSSITSTSLGDILVKIDNDVTVTTASGDDEIILTADLDNDVAISTGAGDDFVDLGGNSIAAVANDAINGGEGIDIIGVDNDIADCDISTKITNFEILAVQTQMLNGDNVDVDAFGGIDTIILEEGYDNAVAINNAVDDSIIVIGEGANVGSAAAAGDVLTVSLDNASAVDDAITLVIESDGLNDYDFGTVKINGIEAVTLDVVADGSASNDVVIGFDCDAGLDNLVITSASELTGVVSKLTIDTAFEQSGITVNAAGAGAMNIEINFDGSSGATYIGSAGNDIVTLGDLGSITGGAGVDTFIVTVVTNGNTYSAIEDAAVGDKLDFAPVLDTAAAFDNDMIELASTASFNAYLDAAASLSDGTNDFVSWFQFGGNTYVVADNDDGNDYFVNGVDSVVQLTGIIDLSNATLSGDVLTLNGTIVT